LDFNALQQSFLDRVDAAGAKSPRGWRAAGLTRSREDHEGWEGGIGCRIFACLAALRAIPTEHRLPEECFSQRRKVAKGMARVGFSTKDTKVTKGGVTDDEELIAKR
jgi:hypothetical protein